MRSTIFLVLAALALFGPLAFGEEPRQPPAADFAIDGHPMRIAMVWGCGIADVRLDIDGKVGDADLDPKRIELWILAADGGTVRIQSRPAQPLSFWHQVCFPDKEASRSTIQAFYGFAPDASVEPSPVVVVAIDGKPAYCGHPPSN